jgi:hypothetical protein
VTSVLGKHLSTVEIFSNPPFFSGNEIKILYQRYVNIFSPLSSFLPCQCTEVGRAPLIDFQKWFLNKVFYILKLFRKFKFYTCMTISGRKSVKKGQKMTRKATNLVLMRFPNIFLSWLI